jgi:hypothetical protein
MPLLDLLADPLAFKFESKTKAFGMDMPGGGDSGLPYIQFGIDDDSSNNQFRQYFNSNRMSLDFPIRGGSVTQVIGETLESPTSQIDRVRIERFLKSDPKGKTFLLKQRGLQLSNPKVQTGDAFFKSISDKMPGLFENTRVFNDGKNLLNQVGAMGTGKHVTRIGNVINNVQEKYYSDIVGKELSMKADEAQQTNRLAILANLKLDQKRTATFLGFEYTSNVSANSNDYTGFLTLEKLGISPLRDRLFSYLGGPGSVYGVGQTEIFRATDTTEASDYELPDGTPMSDIAYTYEQIRTRTGKTLPSLDILNRSGIITDYKDYRDELAGAPSGQWGVDGRIDVKFYDGRVDKLNKIAPYSLDRSDNPFRTDAKPLDHNGNPVSKENSQDLIKFGFECLSNSSFEESTVLLFRAYLGVITDNNTATYNGFKYMGRGENFYVYQGFDRSISFSFKIAIGSHDELDSSYKKLNYLMSQIYPNYNKKTNFMTSPLIRLTIGDYLYRVHGFLESINVTVDQNSTWEINEDEQLPHALDVSVSFKPILNQLPQRGDGTNVPSLIRQTNVPDPIDVITSPTAATNQNAQSDQINLNLNGGNTLNGITPNDIFGMNLGSSINSQNTSAANSATSPGIKQATKNAKKQKATTKATATKKTASTTSPNTATKPVTATPSTGQVPQSISSLGIPTFRKYP